MTTRVKDLREIVRARYAAAATASCCGSSADELTHDAEGTPVFGAALHDEDERGGVSASLGCGVPTAVADLRPGESVLDLGSGAGGDAMICARRVGPTGRVVGLDMTTEMLELARDNTEVAGVDNVDFVHGYLEAIPLPEASMAAWTGCIAGALTESEMRQALQSAGFVDVEIRLTHRVHTHAGAAIIRANR